jgi:FKBP-type peptidyl-prolyl cis-trans isomerase (trigger factor)
MSDGDKKLNFTVDLKPTFELFDYKNIETNQPEITVSDKEISESVEQIRTQHTDCKEVKGNRSRPRNAYLGRAKNAWEEARNENFPGRKAIIESIVGMEIDNKNDIEMKFLADVEITELQGKK